MQKRRLDSTRVRSSPIFFFARPTSARVLAIHPRNAASTLPPSRLAAAPESGTLRYRLRFTYVDKIRWSDGTGTGIGDGRLDGSAKQQDKKKKFRVKMRCMTVVVGRWPLAVRPLAVGRP